MAFTKQNDIKAFWKWLKELPYSDCPKCNKKGVRFSHEEHFKMKNWDCSKNEYVVTSKELKRFFKDIENVCKKHGYSISHEDGHGAFEIEEYSDDNIDWLKNANLRLNGS